MRISDWSSDVCSSDLAGFFRLDEIAELANAGTLIAFVSVAACMMILRRTAPDAKRMFRCPQPYIIGTLAILGCLYLFVSLPTATITRFFIWTAIGLAAYFAYGRRRSVISRRDSASPEIGRAAWRERVWQY